jgi:osmoprotectant transport system permease protein
VRRWAGPAILRIAAVTGWVVLLTSLPCPADGTNGAPPPSDLPAIRVGSKKFTESVILGEIVAALSGNAVHRKELGGTRILWNALLAGEIDVYAEYTGTITEEILAGEKIQGEAAIRGAVARYGIEMTRPLGFDDTYAIGVKEEFAERLGLRTISDLRRHPGLRMGFSNEFMDRKDGWPGLREAYQLPQGEVTGLDHDLAYRGIESGSIDVTDLYSTDAEIAHYRLRVLEDDRRYFPEYQAVLLHRRDLATRAPEFVKSLESLEGRISAEEMIRMNADAKLKKVPERLVAVGFLAKTFDLSPESRVESPLRRILRHTREHLVLVGISLLAAILVSIPLGVLAARSRGVGQAVLAIVGVIQTIPSLALLVFMIPLLGIGALPAMMALFLYSLLPIVRNTYAGLHDIPPSLLESAAALGLPSRARLFRVELPMASRSILAGVKTAAVINVGTATLGALIGAGGYGQPILTGIRLDDVGLILSGAVPAAILALLVQGFFEILERVFVPRGLRIRAAA